MPPLTCARIVVGTTLSWSASLRIVNPSGPAESHSLTAASTIFARPRSGSTPHDRRRASRRATPFLLASNRALEQEGDVLTRSALLLQAPRPHTPLASSPSKNPVVFAPTHNNARHRPPKPHQRSVRDPKIPIGRAAPNQTAPFPTRGFLLTRLSDAGPASRTARLQRAGVRNPSAMEPLAIADVSRARSPPAWSNKRRTISLERTEIRASVPFVS